MLVEMFVIMLPVTILTLLSSPFVVMLAFSLPFQLANLMLGVTYCFSCAALVAIWVLGSGFWAHGAQHLQCFSKRYTVLATLGCFIVTISSIMAIFGYATAFLLGMPLILPYAHLMYELHFEGAKRQT